MLGTSGVLIFEEVVCLEISRALRAAERLSANPLATQTLSNFLKVRLCVAMVLSAIGSNLGREHTVSMKDAACLPMAPVDSRTNGTTGAG